MYKKGVLLTSADALSRLPREGELTTPTPDNDDDDYNELVACATTNDIGCAEDRITINFVDVNNDNDYVHALTTSMAPPGDTEWHTVKEVIKRRKFRGKIQFLVRWESDNTQTWVDRRDITDAAIQQFIAQRNQKRRRRRH